MLLLARRTSGLRTPRTLATVSTTIAEIQTREIRGERSPYASVAPQSVLRYLLPASRAPQRRPVRAARVCMRVCPPSEAP
eukprot:646881-Prymnesium_polylepis.1